MLRHLTSIPALLAILLMAALPVRAQQGSLSVENETDEALTRQDLQTVAQPLVDRGATVAIYFVQKGERPEFDNRLRDDGLMQGDLLLDSLIAIFVSLDDRYSEIAYGDNFKAALDPRAEGIRSGALNKNLREGAYVLAFTRALQDIESVINDPNAPLPSSQTGSSGDGAGTICGVISCLMGMVPFVFLNMLVRRFFPALRGGTYTGGPRYRSSWSGGGSRGSFGGGGRSGGKW